MDYGMINRLKCSCRLWSPTYTSGKIVYVINICCLPFSLCLNFSVTRWKWGYETSSIMRNKQRLVLRLLWTGTHKPHAFWASIPLPYPKICQNLLLSSKSLHKIMIWGYVFHVMSSRWFCLLAYYIISWVLETENRNTDLLY